MTFLQVRILSFQVIGLVLLLFFTNCPKTQVTPSAVFAFCHVNVLYIERLKQNSADVV